LATGGPGGTTTNQTGLAYIIDDIRAA